MEALVDKLCNRFTGVSGIDTVCQLVNFIISTDKLICSDADIKQWEYISYCLSQLSFTEKSTKRLMESFKAYEHVLSEDVVMDHFRNIINKVSIDG